ncbi:MAG: DUF3108 domain-containing protein [Nitrospirota bacterium]
MIKTIGIAICIVFSSISAVGAQPQQPSPSNTVFAPGEKLTYSISWSKLIKAGVAVMEVKQSPSKNEPQYHFVTTTRSVGILETFYPIRDVVESIINAEGMYSLFFSLKESHGSKKRRREIKFDQENHTVWFRLNDDKPETYAIPVRVQDALSSLYHVRMQREFTPDKPILVNVFDSGKTWSVEVYTLGKERIETPAGEFNTIKIRTYPKYEGVFMNQGEIFIWITDDERKIPVLMKSTIMIGSIVATLTHLEGGSQPQ